MHPSPLLQTTFSTNPVWFGAIQPYALPFSCYQLSFQLCWMSVIRVNFDAREPPRNSCLTFDASLDHVLTMEIWQIVVASLHCRHVWY